MGRIAERLKQIADPAPLAAAQSKTGAVLAESMAADVMARRRWRKFSVARERISDVDALGV